jgi:4'-phosphopantetheinyl transferase
LQFSLSASGPIAVLAVADEAVGVDVEILRDDADVESLAQRWLSVRERAAVDGLDAWDHRRAVFEFLTCKEAALKAAGVGFAVSPALVDVAAANGIPPRATVPATPPSTWWIHPLPPAFPAKRAAVGALATREREPTVSFLDWRDYNPS